MFEGFEHTVIQTTGATINVLKGGKEEAKKTASSSRKRIPRHIQSPGHTHHLLPERVELVNRF
jgi:hypothetical protein